MGLNKNPKYDLKRTYKCVLELSIIISLSLLIAAFKYFPDIGISGSFKITPQDIAETIPVPETEQHQVPPPPPKPIIPIKIPDDEELGNIDIQSTELDPSANATKELPPTVVDEEEEEVPDFYVLVEEEPEPICGIAGIQKRISYPEIEVRANVQGKVFVIAYVDENGNVEKVELGKGIGAGCDEEAMNAVQATKFKPGRQRGRAVKVRVVIPVLFKLN